MEQNANAGRKFYFMLPKLAPLKTIVEFVVTLYESLHLAVTPEVSSKTDKLEQEFNAMIETQFELFMDIIAVLLHNIVPELAKEKHPKLRKVLVECFEKYSLAQLLPRCEGGIGSSAIFEIGKYALASNFTEISQECQTRLQEVRALSLL